MPANMVMVGSEEIAVAGTQQDTKEKDISGMDWRGGVARILAVPCLAVIFYSGSMKQFDYGAAPVRSDNRITEERGEEG